MYNLLISCENKSRGNYILRKIYGICFKSDGSSKSQLAKISELRIQIMFFNLIFMKLGEVVIYYIAGTTTFIKIGIKTKRFY